MKATKLFFIKKSPSYSSKNNSYDLNDFKEIICLLIFTEKLFLCKSSDQEISDEPNKVTVNSTF